MASSTSDLSPFPDEGNDDSRNSHVTSSIPDMELDLTGDYDDSIPRLSLQLLADCFEYRNTMTRRQKLASFIANSIPGVLRRDDMYTFDIRAKIFRDDRFKKIISHLKRKVGDRDYVFFVDVSETTHNHEPQLCGVFEAIGYVVKRICTGGMELFLSSNPEKAHHGRSAKKLLGHLKKQTWDEETFGEKFEKFAHGTIVPRLQPRKSRLLLPTPSRKPLTVFVLTDGLWGRDDDQASRVHREIDRIEEQIHGQGLNLNKVSIQFIQFGYDNSSPAFLTRNDFGSSGDSWPPEPEGEPIDLTYVSTRKIVDVNSVHVNIFDIFLAAADPDMVVEDFKFELPMENVSPFSAIPALIPLSTELELGPIDPATHSVEFEIRFGENADTRSIEQPRHQDDVTRSMAWNKMKSREPICALELANLLAVSIRSFDADTKTRTQSLEVLPGLLEAFALKVEHASIHTSQTCPVSGEFILQFKSEISEFVGLKIDRDDDDIQDAEIIGSGGFDWKAHTARWLTQTVQTVGYELDHQQEESPIPIIQPKGQDKLPNEEEWLPNWRKLVLDSPQFEWLITRLRKECELSIMKPYAVRDIGRSVVSSFVTPGGITHKPFPHTYSATLELDWDIMHFFETQEYEKRPEETLEDVITLTGYGSDAQAATCIQYMRQTWSLAGETTLRLIQMVLKDEAEHSCNLLDGTELKARISDSKLIVEANGVVASISETAEQLGWLGAALRTSPRESGLVYCTPTILYISRRDRSPLMSEDEEPFISITCRIGFVLEEDPRAQPVVNGQCWHPIFKNPVIVKGYPIPRRTSWDTGLQIPLNIMAALAQSRRVDHFNGKVYIKGFSTLLVAVKRMEETILWHLIYNKDGSHISFLDDSMEPENDLCHLPLHDFRHVLGWCTEANFYGASVLANHPVTHSRLGRPTATGALFNTSVSSGRIITGGPSFCIGIKDQGIHLSRSGHITQLRWILRKFVLLWDEEEKRGWLINGASALLQLVQASLKYDSEGPFSEVFLFNGNELHQSRTPFTTKSAISVLINDNNRALKLYREDTGFQLFKDRIDHFYNILEKLIEHQTLVAGSHGSNLTRLSRRHLEGWDFQEISKMHDRIDPYVANIDTNGKSWVDFTRAIQAVTLVGRGFGDIIQPNQTDICHQWAKVPTQQYYITSCVSDLRDIIQEHSYENDGHVRLGETTIWHSATSIFQPCQQRGTSDKHCCEPVQTLFPSELARFLQPSKHAVPQDDRGAIIFGHNSNFAWVWGDTGHPQKMDVREVTPLPQAVEVDSESNRDSDIARSLESLRTRDQASSRSGTSSRVTSPSIGLQKSYVKGLREFSDHSMVYTRNEYTVGIICALPKELAAVLALFDSRYDRPKESDSYNDSNHYEFGMMAQHMVVAAALPAGEYGTNSAASVATNMHRSFPALSFCLLVGIGGGVPTKDNDVRLGDVVVGIPQSGWPSVIQYDLGKENGYDEFQRTGTLHDPPRFLRTTISHLIANKAQTTDLLSEHLDTISNRQGMSQYSYPYSEQDVVLESCPACRSSWRRCRNKGAHVRKRPARETRKPMVHYGLIASGNRVIKDAVFRDKLARKDPVLCFEMEAAGVMNELDCLVIRGICDYCDKSKNDAWQEYAAAAAASYAKVYLNEISPRN